MLGSLISSRDIRLREGDKKRVKKKKKPFLRTKMTEEKKKFPFPESNPTFFFYVRKCVGEWRAR